MSKEPSADQPSADQPSADQPRGELKALSLKHKAGDAANRWLERNRNLVLRQTPVWAQSLAAILVSLGGIAIASGFILKIDEVVTVQGQLQSIGGTVEVKTPAGGRVAKVLFKDGDFVDQGQVLVRFDTRQAVDEKATLTSLISLEEKELESRLLTISSQLEMLNGREEVINQKIETKDEIVRELKILVSQGGFQRIQYLNQLDSLFELRKQLSEIDEQKSQLSLLIGQSQLETQKSVDQMRSRLKETELQLQYQTVVAPSSGIVFDPAVREEGVLAAGERILSIVPQVGLYAEVFVPNRDIGFVESGQEAKVRVDAFPFSRYGELSGSVVQIAADSLPPEPAQNFYRFPVKLSLSKSYLESQGAKIPLQSGMAITTNLKLREKRVISLISDMLVDQTDSIKSIRQQ